ncbi:hypothetical protein [Chitinophaga tropicalis]|uniref:Uncharacterized protein n=1 Tax=Chitinophaga tropicalis TaxID=2683588 RepID=A0A7K1UA33_9BACT|nr:hypothetical protein [Chitinophaga tropicalis]MVT11140.1 hypothetical protein [Chitinophaga tropicalis]
MKRIIVLIAFILPLGSIAQTKLTETITEDFSTKMAKRYELRDDSLILFVTEQMSRSGAGGLDIDKTMTELKSDPAALDAALKYLYQFSDCNRQGFIANLRKLNLLNNSVFPLATYTVNKFKNEAKDLAEEKSTLYKTGAIPATSPRPVYIPALAKAKETNAPQEPGSEPAPSTSTDVTPGTDPATTTTTPATATAAPAEDTYNWDVRTIFKLRQPEQLEALYGKDNVVERPATDLLGNEIQAKAYYVFPDTENEMQVVFDGDNAPSVTFAGERSKWKSPFGLKVGDPVEKVNKVNGRSFKINGFEWDNGGTVASWNGGAIDGKGVAILFKANNSGDPKLYDQVTGDKKVSSDLSALKKLEVVVEKIAFKSN